LARIVICEDDPVIMKVILLGLEDQGHDLCPASDGFEGAALIERERPALVLADVAMPGLTGYDLLDSVKRRPDLQHIPVILLSASAQRADIDEGYRRGAADYITKPFAVADLRARIERVMGSERAHDPG
jgi:CheY-like chemotaxis protein